MMPECFSVHSSVFMLWSFLFFLISCAKTILFNLVSPKLVDRALSSVFLFGIQFQEDEEENQQVDFESVLVKVFPGLPSSWSRC